MLKYKTSFKDIIAVLGLDYRDVIGISIPKINRIIIIHKKLLFKGLKSVMF